MGVQESAHHRQREGLALAVGLFTLALALAVSLLEQSGNGTAGLERLSSGSASLISHLSSFLPFGYTFVVGMAAAVNPCGFALLPGYLALYLVGDSRDQSRPLAGRLVVAVQVSLAVTAGFVLLFGATGLFLGLISYQLATYFPLLGLATGLLLVLVGSAMLGGKEFHFGLADRAGMVVGPHTRQKDVRGYFAYGLAYGLCSLGCTLPLFLVVVGSAVTAQGPVSGIGQFILYALGMGLVITTLTVSTAVAGRALLRRVRNLSRDLGLVSAILLLLVGAYVIYYWLTLGGLLKLL